MPQQYLWSPLQGPVLNVAQAYARFARDYREGTHLCRTFDDAVTRHRMLDAIESARSSNTCGASDAIRARSAVAATRDRMRMTSPLNSRGGQRARWAGH